MSRWTAEHRKAVISCRLSDTSNFPKCSCGLQQLCLPIRDIEFTYHVGMRIRFLRDITCGPTGDHPAFIYAAKGEGGHITHVGDCWEGYMVKWDGWQSAAFGCKAKDFEIEKLCIWCEGRDRHKRQAFAFGICHMHLIKARNCEHEYQETEYRYIPERIVADVRMY